MRAVGRAPADADEDPGFAASNWWQMLACAGAAGACAVGAFGRSCAHPPTHQPPNAPPLPLPCAPHHRLICKGVLPIPGAKNRRQVDELAGALGWRLEDGEVAELDTQSAKIPTSLGAPFENW